MKKGSTSLVTRQIIKTAIGSSYTLIRKAKTKKTNDTQCWKEQVTRTVLYYLLGHQLPPAVRKTAWHYFLKLTVCICYDLTISLLGIYPKDVYTCAGKGTCSNVFSRNIPQQDITQPSVESRMNKLYSILCSIYIQWNTTEKQKWINYSRIKQYG